ncbi:putative mitochondrial protein [Trifolium repens]|nr:putative mitochondrial protein [Trifolium repens]
MANGSKLTLKDVKHVPDIRLNLLSVAKLCDEGYNNLFSRDTWKLTKGSMVVARGMKCSTLYIEHAKIIKDVHVVESTEKVELWHKRLCHMSEKDMVELSKRSVLSDMRNPHLKKCDSCFVEKKNKASFNIHSPRRPEILDLVHTHLCGPMKTRTVGGSAYFLTFVDDHSRKTWVYTLKSKSGVLSVFKKFKASVENETGKKLKCIRTNNGGDYLRKLEAYCRENWIRYQRSLHWNGVAERMSKTLVERFECLLSQTELPESFWGEALSTVVHVLNLSPCVSLQHEVPEMIWSGKNVSYDHLRVFGCKASVENQQCVFIGYGLDGVGYRFYDPVMKKLIRCCEAEFIEDQRLKDIDRVRGDDPTHDDDRESCHGIEMQSDVEANAHVKTTQERKPMKRYTVEELVVTSDVETLALVEDADDKIIETCGIVVGMTTDCPT